MEEIQNINKIHSNTSIARFDLKYSNIVLI